VLRAGNAIVVAWEGCPSIPHDDWAGVVARFDEKLRRLWGPIPFSDRRRTPFLNLFADLCLVPFHGASPRRQVCIAFSDQEDSNRGKYAVFDLQGRPQTGIEVFSEEAVGPIVGRTLPQTRPRLVEMFFASRRDVKYRAGMVQIEDRGLCGSRKSWGIGLEPTDIVMGQLAAGESHPIIFYEEGVLLPLPGGGSDFRSESLRAVGTFTACPLPGERFLLAGTSGYAVCDLEGNYVHGPATYRNLELDRVCSIDMPSDEVLVVGLKGDPGSLVCMAIDAAGKITRGPTRIGDRLFLGHWKPVPQALVRFQEDKALLVAQAGHDLVYYVLQ
jgi:hypothetical protein